MRRIRIVFAVLMVALIVVIGSVFVATEIEYWTRDPSIRIQIDGNPESLTNRPPADAALRFQPRSEHSYSKGEGLPCRKATTLRELGLSSDKELIEFVWQKIILDNPPHVIAIKTREYFPWASISIGATDSYFSVWIDFCTGGYKLGPPTLRFRPEYSVPYQGDTRPYEGKHLIWASVLDYPAVISAIIGEADVK